ncbi:hypothetical protein HK100_002583 [Physocladia obscura]|uniref:Uncharacterized protein n=1 Tax=Physocladia obscura TaxID=109957 RepID=A0AAD5T8N0_9FUNG|nr:hypothetical protein HK100_002583 [Physocladia obscura]
MQLTGARPPRGPASQTQRDEYGNLVPSHNANGNNVNNAGRSGRSANGGGGVGGVGLGNNGVAVGNGRAPRLAINNDGGGGLRQQQQQAQQAQLPPRIAEVVRRSLLQQQQQQQQQPQDGGGSSSPPQSSGRPPRRPPPNRTGPPGVPPTPASVSVSASTTRRPDPDDPFDAAASSKDLLPPGSPPPSSRKPRAQRISVSNNLEQQQSQQQQQQQQQQRRRPPRAPQTRLPDSPPSEPSSPPGLNVPRPPQPKPPIPIPTIAADKLLLSGFNNNILREEVWDADTDDEGDTFRLGKGAAKKNIRASLPNNGNKNGATAVAFEDSINDNKPRASIRAVGKSLKQVQQQQAMTTRNVSSVLRVNNQGSNGVFNDDDDDDAATEEMDDIDYMDSLAKVSMPPPRRPVQENMQIPKAIPNGLNVSQQQQQQQLREQLERQFKQELEQQKEKINALEIQLTTERTESARLREAVASNSGELGPILDLLTEKESQLEKLKNAVLIAKAAVDDTRRERDDALRDVEQVTQTLTEQLFEVEHDLEELMKEKQSVDAELAKARLETGRVVEELKTRVQERDDAEIELDTLMEEREKSTKVISDKTTALTQAEATVTRLNKEIDALRTREVDGKKKLADAEARLQYTEIALEKAQMTAAYSVGEVRSRGAVAGEIEEKLKLALKDLHFAKSRESDLERQLEDAEDRLRQAEDAVLDAEAAAESAMSEFDSLKNNSAAAEKTLRNQILSLEEKLELANEDLKGKLDEVEECHDTIGDLDIKVNELENELELTRDELDKNIKNIEDMSKHMDELKGQRDASLQLEIDQLTSERDELLDRVAEMEQDLNEIMRDHHEKVSNLTATLEEVTNNNSNSNDSGYAAETEAKFEDLQAQLKKTLAQLVETEEKIATLEQQNEEQQSMADQELKELESALETANKVRKNLENQIDELLENLDVAESNEAQLRERIKTLEEAVGRNSSNIDGGGNEGLEGVVEDLKAQLDAVLQERDELIEQAATGNKNGNNDRDVAVTSEAHQNALAEVSTLQAELEKVRASAIEFSEEAEELKAELVKTVKERDEAHAELVILKTDIHDLEQMFEEAQIELDKLKNQAGQEADVLKLEQELDSALNEIDDLQAQIKKLQENEQSNNSANVEELETMLEDAKFENEELIVKLDDANANIADLEKLLDEEQAFADRTEATNKSLTDEITSLHERLNRQMELSKADGDTKIVIDGLESEVKKSKSELDARTQELTNLKIEFENSEKVNKELNQALDLADQEIEALNKELDEAYDAKADGAGDPELQAKFDAIQSELEAKNAELDVAVEVRLKEKVDEFKQLEEELREQMATIQEQSKGATQSLVQQLQEQELDAKEMRETLVSRLREQESEATDLRDNLAKLKADFAETLTKLKNSEHTFEEYRLRSQAMEKRYLARLDLVEDAFNQTCAEIESFRANLLQAAEAQGIEPPQFKPIPVIPPANFESPISPTPAEKKTFLSTVFGRRPSEKPNVDKHVATPSGTPMPSEEHAAHPAQSVSPTLVAAQENGGGADTKTLKNKPSTGILRSLWGSGGNKAGDQQQQQQQQTSPPQKTPPGSVMDIKPQVVGADDEAEVPKPSTLLASIWGAKSNLKRTPSEPKLDK